MTRFFAGLTALILSTFTLAQSAIAQAPEAEISGALTGLEARFESGDAAGFAAAIADLPEGTRAATIGHLLYTRRQFDKAAWFFGTDAVGDPTHAPSLNNFAALLLETTLDDPEAAEDDWLEAAHLASLAAIALSPDEAAFHNNLSNIARALGNADEAVTAARRATELDPTEPLFWTNLARALDLAGDATGAGEALARARVLDPNGVPFSVSFPALPNAHSAYSNALQNVCNVNYHCQDICPKSIIGGLMSVTCEIESAGAQIACLEGRPYAPGYECRENIPEYGILIPGLNAGFSILVPGFSAHVLVDGDGTVNVRVEGGFTAGRLGAYLRADGHFTPDGGASFDNVGGGVRINLLPASPANKLATDYSHSPVQIETEWLDGQNHTELEIYEATPGELANAIIAN